MAIVCFIFIRRKMVIESLWVEEGARSTAREIESLGFKSNRGSTMEREHADKIL